jgi:hypothetical protein
MTMICHFKELEFISVANFMYLNQIKYKVKKIDCFLVLFEYVLVYWFGGWRFEGNWVCLFGNIISKNYDGKG